jgi:hypothetical protein
MDASATQIEESIVATTMLKFAPAALNWYGTATELLKELGDQVGRT